MSHEEQNSEPSSMMDEVRIRVPKPNLPDEIKFSAPLPILIPLAALAAIAVIAFLFSRVLLAVPREAAILIAIVMAANILGGFAFAALRPKLSRSQRIELAMVIGYPLLIGIVIARLGFGAPAHEASAEAGGGTAVGGDAVLVADSLAFDTDAIELEAGKTQTIGLDNQDSATHDLSIYKNEEAGVSQQGALFEGEDVPAGSSTEYEVDPLDAGKLYFQCDIHPSMKGDVVVSGSGAGGSGKNQDGG
ncbi:MAG: cupredoxin domain-containing protein [Actinomycetota bacterium]|nr:cupredoxin domain-containing protein [Actinomycetota bacterium]